MTPNEFGSLEVVALRHPDAALGDEERIAAQWQDLSWHSAPNLVAARTEYAAFEALLREAGAEIVHLPADDGLTLDSLYVRDALIVTPGGLVLAAMGKQARAGEPAASAAALKRVGYPVAGAIEPPGKVEGGDLVWLDADTLVAGHTYRTNPAGIAQLAALVGSEVRVHTVQMPHYRGPGDVFHLMSVLSPIDRDLALVYPPLAPVALMQLLAERGIATVAVPDEEFESMGCNVLATGARHCIMVAGNPETRRRLEAAGAEVHEIAAAEICRKGEGGPTCLTRPLRRKG